MSQELPAPAPEPGPLAHTEVPPGQARGRQGQARDATHG